MLIEDLSVDLGDEVARKSFLGGEFLMWLWYRVEREENTFTIGDNAIELHFDDQLILEVKLAEAEQTRLKGGAPAHSPEAYKALQYGKRILKARIRLSHNEREWLFMLNADNFAMSGIKVPAVMSEDNDDKLDERLYLIDELDRIWNGIYHAFLRVRLSKEWEKEADAIRTWIKNLREHA